jgi:uracil phosphoribosyltransferase
MADEAAVAPSEVMAMEKTTKKDDTVIAEAETETEAAVAKLGANVHISNHPVLKHKISVMRSSSTLPPGFRASLREVTFHLGYEATSTLTTRTIDISVPTDADPFHHMDAKGQKLKEKIAFVPILRSGLGMVDPMLELIPSAAVHHIGMYKRKSDNSEGQHNMPVMYYNRLPKKCTVDMAYVLDPIVGTAATTMSVIGILKKVRTHCILYVCSLMLCFVLCGVMSCGVMSCGVMSCGVMSCCAAHLHYYLFDLKTGT